jgi:hypothetical protein
MLFKCFNAFIITSIGVLIIFIIVVLKEGEFRSLRCYKRELLSQVKVRNGRSLMSEV